MIHPEALVAWRDRAVLTMTMAAQEQAWQRTTEPCQVRITAMFARPLSHYGTGRNKGVLKPSAPVFHATTPDLDKIARAVCDALTVAGIWADDKQAAELTARRQWAAEGQPDQTIIEVTLL